MGDPRRLKNKYSRPKKLWEKERITEEKTLKSDYGLKNMRELWVALAELKRYRREARRLLSLTEEERVEDSKKILSKLQKMGVLKEGSTIDDILGLDVKHILERRLQTVVYRKGLATTPKQSRQLIAHGFIQVNGTTVTVPSYVINLANESSIAYSKQIDIQRKEEKVVKEEGEAPKEEAEAPKPEAS